MLEATRMLTPYVTANALLHFFHGAVLSGGLKECIVVTTRPPCAFIDD